MKKLFLLFLAIVSSAYSQSEPITDIDKKHKIILKGQLGLAPNYRIPEAEENKKDAELNNFVDFISGSRTFSTSKTTPATGFSPQMGIEYRFFDRLRLMADRRTFSSANSAIYSKAKESSSYITDSFSINTNGRYTWTETVQKYGIAYYQPILSFFSIGGILRRYDISQEYNIFRKSTSGEVSYLKSPLTQQEKEVSQSTINGIVPGFGMEFYFLKMFEIRYTYELVNLNGVKSERSLLNLNGIIGMNFQEGKFKYTGEIQNLDIGFKLPALEWFILRFGITEEKLKRNYAAQYNGFLIFSNFNLINSSSVEGQVLNSLLYSQFTDSEVRFRNFYTQFETNLKF